VGKWDTDKLGKYRLVPSWKFKKVVKVFGVSFSPSILPFTTKI